MANDFPTAIREGALDLLEGEEEEEEEEKGARQESMIEELEKGSGDRELAHQVRQVHERMQKLKQEINEETQRTFEVEKRREVRKEELKERARKELEKMLDRMNVKEHRLIEKREGVKRRRQKMEEEEEEDKAGESQRKYLPLDSELSDAYRGACWRKEHKWEVGKGKKDEKRRDVPALLPSHSLLSESPMNESSLSTPSTSETDSDTSSGIERDEEEEVEERNWSNNKKQEEPFRGREGKTFSKKNLFFGEKEQGNPVKALKGEDEKRWKSKISISNSRKVERKKLDEKIDVLIEEENANGGAMINETIQEDEETVDSCKQRDSLYWRLLLIRSRSR